MKKFLSAIQNFWKALKDDIRSADTDELLELYKALLGMLTILSVWIFMFFYFPIAACILTAFVLVPAVMITVIRSSDDKNQTDLNKGN